LFAIGCHPSQQAPEPSKTVLTIGVPEAIAGAEFSLQNLASNISLEGLAQLSSDGRALPKLAEGWTWEEDGLVLRARIRKGIIFHDGTPLTAPLAADILKKAIAKPANRVLYTSFVDVMNVEANGDLELAFRLSRHSAFLPEDLEIPLEISNGGIGTGAYRITKSGTTEVDLVANDHYYLGSPRIGQVVIRPFPALRTAWSSLLRGDVDMVTDVPPDAVEFVKNDAVQVVSFGRRYQYVVAFNTRRAPFGRPIVRKALNLAINRQALISDVLHGQGSPSTGPIWPQHWAYDSSLPGFGYDPALAVSLLESSGLHETARKSGPRARLRFTCLIPENFSLIERIGLNVQKQLYDIGVDMQFEVVRAEDLNARIRSGRFDALLIEMLGGPTLGRAYMFWGSEKSFLGMNVFGYEDPQAERLFNVLRTTTNEGAIRTATRSLQQVLLEDPPAVFLAWNQRSRAVRRDFQIVQDPTRDPADPVYTIWRWNRNGSVPQASTQ
jgi:peptide/nickel transport system substrate-binding protein